MRLTILQILEEQPTATADDVHDRLKIPSECMYLMPNIFRGMQAAGEIVLMEIIRSKRPGQNGNRIGVWRLAG
ncbi:MAG: hypothetical protein Fues2KO_34740 [Fuerstiella sp.]